MPADQTVPNTLIDPAAQKSGLSSAEAIIDTAIRELKHLLFGLLFRFDMTPAAKENHPAIKIYGTFP